MYEINIYTHIHLEVLEEGKFVRQAYRLWSGSPTMSVSWWKGWEFMNCHSTGCLSHLDLALEPWRILGKLLIFSLHWNPEGVLIQAKDCLCSRVDELTSEREGKGKNQKSLSSKLFNVGCHQNVGPWLWVGLPPQIAQPKISLKRMPSSINLLIPDIIKLTTRISFRG